MFNDQYTLLIFTVSCYFIQLLSKYFQTVHFMLVYVYKLSVLCVYLISMLFEHSHQFAICNIEHAVSLGIGGTHWANPDFCSSFVDWLISGILSQWNRTPLSYFCRWYSLSVKHYTRFTSVCLKTLLHDLITSESDEHHYLDYYIVYLKSVTRPHRKGHSEEIYLFGSPESIKMAALTSDWLTHF